jgi:hypothetical protein
LQTFNSIMQAPTIPHRERRRWQSQSLFELLEITNKFNVSEADALKWKDISSLPTFRSSGF